MVWLYQAPENLNIHVNGSNAPYPNPVIDFTGFNDKKISISNSDKDDIDISFKEAWRQVSTYQNKLES